MRTMMYAVAAVVIGFSMTHAQPQYPTAEVPTSEPAYLAKVKTAAPEPMVSQATIIMMQEGVHARFVQKLSLTSYTHN